MTTNQATALDPEAVDRALDARGIHRFTGVPCSYFSGLLRLWEGTGRYVAAANEGAATAIACGSTLGGVPCAVVAQNSGLGNLVNPLTSLAAPYGIGVLLMISHRGDPDGPPDEPQHRLMGEATVPLLDTLRVPNWRLPRTAADVGPVLDAACDAVAAGRVAALVVSRGTFQDAPARTPDRPSAEGRERPTTAEVMAELHAVLTDELVVSTTGYTSRWLFDAADRPANFYMQGSMGHAISIGLGLSLARPDRRVFVLDGDGACLMHLGALGTVGALAPSNLVHVVLDNQRYESTGGQPSAASATRFEDAARGLGYRWTGRITSSREVRPTLADLARAPGPALLVIDVREGGAAPPRATASLSPETIRARFGRDAQQGRQASRIQATPLGTSVWSDTVR